MDLRILFLIIVSCGIIFTVVGFANTLTADNPNRIRTFEVESSVDPKVLKEIIFGLDDTITQVQLSLTGSNKYWSGRTLDVILYDGNGAIIGSGQEVATDNDPVINLSDIVTASERPTLRKASVSEV